MTLIEADTYRRFGASGWRVLLRGLLTHRTFRVVITMRLCQRPGLLRPLWQICHWAACRFAVLDFPGEQGYIGSGFAITHGYGVILPKRARIGSNCTVFHGVTIGRRRIWKEGAYQDYWPVIEDEVWIGAHAVVIGNIRIGRGSRIAPGAFVTTDIPPYSLVVGNPAQIVRSNCTPDVNNRVPV
jgi:serine O-acetyltransferase